MNARWFGLLLILALVACLLPLVAPAAVATAVQVTGEVRHLSVGGPERALVTDDPLQSGETVVTANGRAELLFTDGARIKLARHSRLTIKEYAFNGQEDGSERAVFDLLKGGLRTVTGQIGRRNPSSYRMDGPVATLGLRGTSYRLLVCQGDCVALADGLYVSVAEGKVFVRNNRGVQRELDVAAGQAAFVPAPDAAPRLILPPPQLLQDDLRGGGGDSGGGGPGGGFSPAWYGNINPGAPVKPPPPAAAPTPAVKPASPPVSGGGYNPLNDPALNRARRAGPGRPAIAAASQFGEQFQATPAGPRPGPAIVGDGATAAPVPIPESYSQPSAAPPVEPVVAATPVQPLPQTAGDDDIIRMADPNTFAPPVYQPGAATGGSTPVPAAPPGVPSQVACNATTRSGSNQAAQYDVELGQSSGQFTFSYDMMSVPDQMIVSYQGAVLYDTGCVGNRQGAGRGTGSRGISYSGRGSKVRVEVRPACAGGSTNWRFTLACPGGGSTPTGYHKVQ